MKDVLRPEAAEEFLNGLGRKLSMPQLRQGMFR